MISRIYIKNFKSIKGEECSLPRFAALVGRNAAGKTNILQAIGVLKELVAGDSIDVVVGKISLVPSDILNKDTTEKVAILGIDIIDKDDNEYSLETHILLVNGNTPANFIVNYEKLSVKKTESQKNIVYERKENQIEDGNGNKILVAIDPKRLLISLFANPEAEATRNLFKNVTIPDSQLMDERESIAGVTEENLTGLLIRLRHNQPQLYADFEKITKKLLPTFTNITELASRTEAVNSPSDEQQYLVLFEERHLRGQLSIKLLSAGDVRTLYAIAIAIGMPECGTLIFEEIENGIHQQRIDDIIDQLDSISRVKNIQIIFTTHSEKVINRIAPQEVLYVEKDLEKGTRIINLDDPQQSTHIQTILSKGGSLVDYLNVTFNK